MPKRAFDVAIATFLLVATLPLLAVVALAVRWTSPGAALFRQQRVGMGCRPFWIFKFRSMVSNAESIGTYYTSQADARITPFGRWLRRTSIDELPQLINVLNGDMSLVGPRPDLLVQRDQYTAEQWTRRHAVRPGITGLAQATLRSSATPEQRLALDLEYVERASLGFDLAILAKTVKRIVFQGGGN